MFDVYMDDVRNVPNEFVRTMAPKSSLALTRTIADTQALLETGLVRRLSLDHDMGACSTCAREGKDVGDMKSPETTYMFWCPHAVDGTSFVQWMVAMDCWPKERPTVHSMNPVAAARMRDLIENNWHE